MTLISRCLVILQNLIGLTKMISSLKFVCLVGHARSQKFLAIIFVTMSIGLI